MFQTETNDASANRDASALTPAAVAAAPAPAAITSHSLLGGGRELLIRHGDTWYRLRHTRNDKLILTK